MKIVDYFMHTPQGQIVMVGQCPESDLPLQSLPGASLRQGKASLSDYFDGFGVRPIPSRPSKCHVFDWTTKTWRADVSLAWEQVRAERDQRISMTDWTTLPDVPLSDERRAQWAAYRQALRDITTQKDPLNIVWPNSPA